MALNVVSLYNSYTTKTIENMMVKAPLSTINDNPSVQNANFYTNNTINGVSNVQTAGTTTITTTGTTTSPIYRGFLGGNYVYQTGSPPGGATDITIVGYITQ